MDWRQVSREEFYAVVNRLDIRLSSKPAETIWETPARQVVGRSTPGYLCQDEHGRYTPEKTYYLPA